MDASMGEHNQADSNNQDRTQTEATAGQPHQLERRIGLTIALFAAVLAVVDLGGGKYGDDEIIGTNEKANLYQWYQSKSIKQSVIEQEAQLLSSLLSAGAVTAQGTATLQQQLQQARASIARYDLEKREILLGSEAVGPAGQVLVVDGDKGAIVGTKVWERTLKQLATAGDQFDLATLWLQLALVFGAISLIINSDKLKASFYYALVIGSLVGTGFGIQAFHTAMAEPAAAESRHPGTNASAPDKDAPTAPPARTPAP
jgi:hypothetical protein